MKKACRFCSRPLEKIFVDLGLMPLSNAFIRKENLDKQENVYPLTVYVCENCLLAQVPEFETPEKIFSEYAYFSSYSSSWLKHVESYVEMILKRFRFDMNSLVIELASNDGYLLQFFKKKHVPVLGIEPAENVARAAIKKSIPTLVHFFSKDFATKLVNGGKQADLIIANNVLAHVSELNKFVDGIKILLKDKGVATIEFPHLLNLIEKNQFDTIYHEHYSYFSLFSAISVFSHHDLEVFDVEEIPTHGGSLRIYVKHKLNNVLKQTRNVNTILEKEKQHKLNNIDTYNGFSSKVSAVKKELCEFLTTAKKSNKKIVGYGAPAKGNTLLNFCKIGTNLLPYTVDKNNYKQGLFLPGTHIPIKSPDEIKNTKPDYLLILPWNIKSEIMEEMSYIKQWGGRFVIPIPEVQVI